MPIQRINQVESGIDKLLSQFEDKPNINNILTSYLNEVQETQLAYGEMLDERSLSAAIGVQLDNIGRIVGERRDFREDTEYRIAIVIRIALNSSTGELSNIIEILKILYPDTGKVKYWEHYPASISMMIEQEFSPRQAFILNGVDQYWKISTSISATSTTTVIIHFDDYSTGNHGIELLSTDNPLDNTSIYIDSLGFINIMDKDGVTPNPTGLDISGLLVDGYNEIVISGMLSIVGLKDITVNGTVTVGVSSQGIFTDFNTLGGFLGERSNPLNPNYNPLRKNFYEGYFRYVHFKNDDNADNDLEFRLKSTGELSSIGLNTRRISVINMEDDVFIEVSPDLDGRPNEETLNIMQAIIPSGVRLNNIGYGEGAVFTPYDSGLISKTLAVNTGEDLVTNEDLLIEVRVQPSTLVGEEVAWLAERNDPEFTKLAETI